MGEHPLHYAAAHTGCWVRPPPPVGRIGHVNKPTKTRHHHHHQTRHREGGERFCTMQMTHVKLASYHIPICNCLVLYFSTCVQNFKLVTCVWKSIGQWSSRSIDKWCKRQKKTSEWEKWPLLQCTAGQYLLLQKILWRGGHQYCWPVSNPPLLLSTENTRERWPWWPAVLVASFLAQAGRGRGRSEQSIQIQLKPDSYTNTNTTQLKVQQYEWNQK